MSKGNIRYLIGMMLAIFLSLTKLIFDDTLLWQKIVSAGITYLFVISLLVWGIDNRNNKNALKKTIDNKNDNSGKE